MKQVIQKQDFEAALENFLADTAAVRKALDDATRCAELGEQAGHYELELWRDGTWRVQHSTQIGNLYRSDGIVMSIPPLNEADRRVVDDEANEIHPPDYDGVEQLIEDAYMLWWDNNG